jgi:hypothetical protein
MNYACTYLGEWERELFQHSDQHPLSYWRYVDDVWGLWIHGENSLHNFGSVANSMHPRIKLELRYSTDSIEFLDFRTSLINAYLKTDLFTKDTDKQQYLHISSNHPKTVKEYIPYGLGLRVKRICSDQNDYQKRKRDLNENMKKRGYSSNLHDNNRKFLYIPFASKGIDAINISNILNRKEVVKEIPPYFKN